MKGRCRSGKPELQRERMKASLGQTVLVVFLSLQRYYIQGMLGGALKQ